jgi:hypothetical protein
MPLSPAQQEIASSPRRFRVAICGRRFGKTYLATRELCRFAREPFRRVWAVAPTRLQAKGLFWEPLKNRLGDLRWIKKINESELSITLRNGSIIELRSADAYDRMRGYSVDFMVLDEFADQDPDVWTVTRPTLSDRLGHALFIGTPKGSQNWARDMYDMSKHSDDWQSWSFTTLDGGRVTESEIDAARRDLDERTFRQEYMATFEDAGNRIFYAFGPDNIRKYEGTWPNQIFVGMDFNYSPMTAVIGLRSGEELHIINEIRMMTSNTDEMTQELKSRYPHLAPNRIWVYPDPASRQNKTSAGGRTDLSILQNAGFTVKCPNSHEPVRDGINAVNSRLLTAAGERRLFIDPKCKYTIESMERWTYKEGTTVPDKDSGYDHFADCVRYMISYIWPVKRDLVPQPAQRWTHRTI